MADDSDSLASTLATLLEGDYWRLKKDLRSRIDGHPLFDLRFDLPITEQRKVTFERAKYIFSTPEVQQQFENEAKGEPDFINKSLAIGEIVSCTDLSVGVKCGVMGWLFGGAVKNLGTKEHLDKWFMPLKNLDFTGMFCMSELGHGSNVRGLETEAHYDPQTEEFIINTPTPNARKIYIGNALNGEYAAVFAQLMAGGKNRGPHCFIVPIRTCDGLLPGISVEDLGPKEGLNGVDNGMLSFDHVRIPRSHLLNRYASVTTLGDYVTSINSDGARFNASLGALLGTRLALCFQAITAMKVGLEIAVRYGLQRRQFGAKGQPEQLLMDYQTHQLRLMPALATTLALTFATRFAGSMLNHDIDNDIALVDDRKLQALAAGLKAYSTWEAVSTLQTCRECCGGMGYMEENRLSNLKRDADVFVTFEGDNVVMLQQVVKELLTQYGNQFGGSKIKATIHTVLEGIKARLKTSLLAVETHPPTSVSYVLKALEFKEGFLLRALAGRLLNKVSSLQEEPFLAWNDCLDHVMALASCYVQKVTLHRFAETVEKCPIECDQKILQLFCQLYAVHLINNDRAWFLEQHYMSPTASKEIRDKFIELCQETRGYAMEVIEAFCHPRNCVHAPIAGVYNERAAWAYHPPAKL